MLWARSLAAILVLMALAFLISMDRRAIKPRVVGAALATQIAIGGLILFFPAGRAALAAISVGVNHIIDYGNSGISFMFGALVGPKMQTVFGPEGFAFGLKVLPMIIFMTALISALYYLGVMRWVVLILGTIFHKLLGVSRLESFSAVTTIFLGQSEMPAVVKPFIHKMSGPELFAVMASGMAAVTGSVLAGYAGLGVQMDYLIAASFMAIPGGLLFGKMICPGTLASDFDLSQIGFDQKRPTNVIEAISSGAAVGLKIALSVGAMLIAFIGIIALLNGLVAGFGDWFGHPEWSLEQGLGLIFAPIAYLLGISWDQATLAGSFIGQKLILNEFVAYINLSPYLRDAEGLAAAGKTVLDQHAIAVVSVALCGFANFSSIAILVGGFGTVAPERRAEVARYGLRVVAAATLSNLMSANIAGFFLSLQ